MEYILRILSLPSWPSGQSTCNNFYCHFMCFKVKRPTTNLEAAIPFPDFPLVIPGVLLQIFDVILCEVIVLVSATSSRSPVSFGPSAPTETPVRCRHANRPRAHGSGTDDECEKWICKRTISSVENLFLKLSISETRKVDSIFRYFAV